MNKRATNLLNEKVLPWVYRLSIISIFEIYEKEIETPQFLNSFLTAAMPQAFNKEFDGEKFFPNSIKSKKTKIYADHIYGGLSVNMDFDIEGRRVEMRFNFDKTGKMEEGIINYIHEELGEIRQVNLKK